MRSSICYFGSYEPSYARNRIIKKGLTANNLKVLQCQASGIIFIRYLKLVRSILNLKYNFQAIIVGFPGHYDVPLAFLLGKIFKKKVFFDIFASTYETYILDRQVVKKNSFRAKFFYLLDWLSLHLSDYVIVDTNAHKDFYNKLFGIRGEKQIVVYVGSDNTYFYPRKLQEETDVLFYGSYQPLQGAEFIIEAASKIPTAKFRLIGDGQQKQQVEKLAKKLDLKNIEFLKWMPLKDLAEQINKAKIVLGIFGKEIKAQIVIPNKVYDAIASQKAVITADTKAAREILSDHKNALLIQSANADKLAVAVKQLLKNNMQRKSLADGAFRLYKKSYQPDKIVQNLIRFIS